MAPPGEYRYRDATSKKVWNFVWLNLVAIAGMLALFFVVLYGDGLTGVFTATWRWFSDHQVLMALAASTPFFAALLVGRASSARAKRKRLAQARQDATRDAAQARARRVAGRSDAQRPTR